MHTEVHVHGLVPLKNGVTQAEVEQALRAWLDYVDLDGLADATSAHQDEPGVVFDRRRRVLDICWTGWVGRNFQRALDTAPTDGNRLRELGAQVRRDESRERRVLAGIVAVPQPEKAEAGQEAGRQPAWMAERHGQ